MSQQSHPAIEVLTDILREGDNGELTLSTGGWGDVKNIEPLGGGSINQVWRISFTEGKSLVLKYHARPPAGFFAAEAQGLAALREAGAVRVPKVYAVGSRGIVLEWLSPAAPGDDVRQAGLLGRQLAELHRTTAGTYGFVANNFVGLLPQSNLPGDTSWVAFYTEKRLQPQLELARRQGRMNPQRERWAERLIGRLAQFIDEGQVQPSLLHGDLWSGNWLATESGPALIDPAVYFGDREIDLAMASLFGGFPRSFFDAYNEAYPLAPGYAERRPLYQLYYLLIHLNLFGQAYGPSVDRVLRRYGG